MNELREYLTGIAIGVKYRDNYWIDFFFGNADNGYGEMCHEL
jgi:hypothetical protein